MPSRIEDYALLGDCLTAALVAKNGSIDWLCFPRFDSPACFAALLGNEQHGHWQISPAGKILSVERRYRQGTLILETDYVTADGRVTIIDCMPPRTAEPDVVRMVVGREGNVAMRMELVIRYDYGSIVPWVRHTERGIRAIAGPEAMVLDTPLSLRGENMQTVADFSVAAGDQVPFVLMWYPSHQTCPGPLDAAATIQRTEEWWRDWSASFTFQGNWHEEVLRSAITLKALTYAPTGGIVAAATTSLPESIGGVRNWDYRYCWLRDATFTLYSLLETGFHQEAHHWRDWLLRAIAGNPSQLNIMYGLAGERRLTELTLDWLPGYESSRPVRTGNDAHQQLQLDVFGEVIDALYVAHKFGVELDDDSWRVLRTLTNHLCNIWQQPDEGIWEVRGERRHFTHSKVMAWVALDRMVRAAEKLHFDAPITHWRASRTALRQEILEKGYDARRNTFDAALLMIPMVGFLDAKDPRMLGTVQAIRRELAQDGFIARYPTHPDIDGLPAGEGAFLPCTFWLVDNLALQGRYDEAREQFERLLSLCNDVGLLSEEYDPRAKRLLGNFPQAFSHVGLINSALNLARAHGPAEARQED
jgi:GH15 family glucan-1,4-alpha-glucosidase